MGAASAFYRETQGDPTGGGSASVAALFGRRAGPPVTTDQQSRRVRGDATGSSPTSPWSTDLRLSEQQVPDVEC